MMRRYEEKSTGPSRDFLEKKIASLSGFHIKCVLNGTRTLTLQEAVAFHISFSSGGDTSQFLSNPLLHTILFLLLIKTAKRSVAPTAADAGFGGRFRLVFV